MDKDRDERYAVYAIIGALIGGLIGFSFRPHVPVVGQLPLSVVMTAGSNLSGFEQYLKPVAETSFGYLALGTLMGLVGGVVLVETMRLGAPARRPTLDSAREKPPRKPGAETAE